MSELFLGLGALVLAAGSVIFNKLTEEEERRYEEYRKTYYNLYNHYKSLTSELADKAEKLREPSDIGINLDDIYNLHINYIKYNHENYNQLIKNFKDIKDKIESYMQENILSLNKRFLLKQNLLILDEAIAKAEAYLEYLKYFTQNLEKLYYNEKYTEKLKLLYLPPVSPNLPDDYWYDGKVIEFPKSEFSDGSSFKYKNNYGQSVAISSKYQLYQEEYKCFVYYEKESVPIMLGKNKENFYYGSFIKGIMKKHYIENNIPIPMKVNRDTGGYVLLSMYNFYKKNWKLPYDYKQFPVRKYKDQEPLEVYAIEYDYKLENIVFSEIIPENLFSKDQVVIFLKEGIDYSIIEELDKVLEDELLKIKDVKINNNQIQSITFIAKNYEIYTDVVKEENSDFIIIYANDISKTNETQINDQSKYIFLPLEYAINVGYSLEEAFEYVKLVPSYTDTMFNFFELLNIENTYLKSSKESELSKFIKLWLELNQLELRKKKEKDISINILDSSMFPEFLVVKKTKEVEELLENSLKTTDSSVFLKAPSKINNNLYKILEQEDANIKEDKILLKFNTKDIKIEELENYNIAKACLSAEINKDPAIDRQIKAITNFINGSALVNGKIKDYILYPELLKQEKKKDVSKLRFINNSLTESQKEAILKALSSNNISIIQGPPGTGKTTVISEIISQTLSENPNARILIASQQNVAVDNVLRRLKDIYGNSIVRIGSQIDKIQDEIKAYYIKDYLDNYKSRLKAKKVPSRLEPLMQEWLSLLENSNKTISAELNEFLTSSMNIIGATCVGLANRAIGLDKSEFDLVIIDEAGRANVGELLIPLNRAKKTVLVGDHFQLPPMISKDITDDIKDVTEIEKEFINKSLFERLFESFPESNKSILREQFRMPDKIGNLVSNSFYNGKLLNGIIKDSSKFLFPRSQLIWIDVVGKEANYGTSKYNEKEIEQINKLIDIITKILQFKKINKQIAIITPYSHQKHMLKSQIQGYDNIKIDVVDAFQGEEADIVIYSTVRTKGNINFILDTKRLNVAISRTRENLVMVGHKDFLHNHKDGSIFRSIIDSADIIQQATDIRAFL